MKAFVFDELLDREIKGRIEIKGNMDRSTTEKQVCFSVERRPNSGGKFSFGVKA